jgi:nucleotide-binding universal stress UspA family protein
MFHNVLVGLSLASASEHVLDEAVAIADQHHGRLTILTVVPDCRAAAFGPIETYTAARDAAADLLRDGQAAQRAALLQVPACLPVATLLCQGPAWPALMRELRTGRHDSIVVGASAASPLARLLRRATGERLVRRSPVPVLVVPPDGPPALHVPRPRPRPLSARGLAGRLSPRPRTPARR